MIILTLIFVAVFVTWINWYMNRITAEASHAEWTRKNFNCACQAVEEWEKQNPFKNSSDPEAQRLLRIRLGAYMLMAAANPYLAKQEQYDLYNEDVYYWTT